MYRKYKSLVKQHPSIKKRIQMKKNLDKDKADICQSAEENQPKEDKAKVPRQLVTFHKIFNLILNVPKHVIFAFAKGRGFNIFIFFLQTKSMISRFK